ncbi:MAG: hypothetical protein JSV09_02975 [Thermoplasmata archaeon]|nr:MAG: hypothetical protein JSV09_02975 [Thermoplasmata archaeon]
MIPTFSLLMRLINLNIFIRHRFLGGRRGKERREGEGGRRRGRRRGKKRREGEGRKRGTEEGDNGLVKKTITTHITDNLLNSHDLPISNAK